MASLYTREQLKLSIAKMCLTIGWHTTMTTPIELLTDILCNYLCQLSKLTNDYATGFGLNEASVDHLLLSFKDFHVNLRDLGDFVKNVDCPEPPSSVPLYPIPREDHLNFLKPGSKEVITRQVHVHEHLPPMFPHLEEEDSAAELTSTIDEKAAIPELIDIVFKRPAEVSQDVFKRPRILSDLEAGRPTREISSVIMTSSGFLSPSREGRLPEARTPAIALEPCVLPVSPEPSESVKKTVKGIKKSEKLKDYSGQKLFKPYEDVPFHKDVPYKDASLYKDSWPYKDPSLHKNASHKNASVEKDALPYKNTSTSKDVSSYKDTPFYKDPPSYKDSIAYKDSLSKKDSHYKHHNNLKGNGRNKVKHHSHTNGVPPIPIKSYMVVKDSKSDVPYKKPPAENDNHSKFNKTLAAARMKTEKFNTTITPIPPKSIPATIVRPEQLVDKLFTEPDKKKVNILKRISVKSDKGDRSYKIKEEAKSESKGNSSNLIIDEPGINVASHNLPKDITIELINPPPVASTSSKKKLDKSDKFDKYYFDDYSPPGTPSTPRTPEMVSDSPYVHKGGKHKSKTKHRKIHKYSSPSAIETDIVETELERPITPDSSMIMKPERIHMSLPPMHFPFFAPFSGPGLIPTPLATPLFPHLGMSSLGLPSFGQPPYIPSIHPPMNFMSNSRSPVLPASTVTSPKSVTAAASSSNQSPTAIPQSFSSRTSSPVVSSTVVKDDEYYAQPSSSTHLDRILPPFIRHDDDNMPSTSGIERKSKEHKKDKKDKPKKKNKKDKDKYKAEKRKLKAEKKEKSRTKKERKEKKKKKQAETEEESPCLPKLTLKLPPKKINIKAVVKPVAVMEPQPSTSKAPDTPPRETSPEIARFSALVTGQPKARTTRVASTSREEEVVSQPGPSRRPGRPRIHPIRQRPAARTTRSSHRSSSEDSEGKTVWICPGCGIQDDGSPMIGCDDCDAWYHWVCVGIQVPPDDNEDWYCRHCIHKNRDLLKRGKRKKRKTRERRTRRRH